MDTILADSVSATFPILDAAVRPAAAASALLSAEGAAQAHSARRGLLAFVNNEVILG
jgi:hypothetical protein